MLRGQNLLQFDLHGPVSDQVKLASLNGHSSKSEASTNSRGNDTLNRRVPRGKGLKHWAVAILLVVSSCSLLQIAASSLLLPAKAAAPDSGLVKTMQMDMESSLGSTRDCTPVSVSTVSTNRPIPLLCTVCPEAPRFSDVSHLLTHIASKGHLHHETQTKLKAHQDIAASVALQQYERWYKENGIETLLVERMRAKQKKEAVKNSRTRDSIPFSQSKLRRKSRRSGQRTVVKAEEVEFPHPHDFALYTGFSPSDHDVDLDEVSIIGSDMLSLKGQVWPGMGKMDLANDDMKRTRNQRKPNSVIEKMRRTSERIEPTQVVMTSDFEVERIKGVYESSSPIPDEETETPKRVARPKRKRPQALAEISGNVPRRGRRPSSRRNAAAKNTSSAPKENMKNMLLTNFSNSASIRHGHDVFRDDENRTSASSSLSGPSYSVTDSPIYNYGSRFPFSPYSNVGISGNDMFQFNPSHHLPQQQQQKQQQQQHHQQRQQQAKQEAHPSPVHRDLLDGTGNHQFLHMSQSQSNPLFSQDRGMFGSYHVPEPMQPLSGLSLDSLNHHSLEHNQTPTHDQDVRCNPIDNVKLEHSSDMVENDMHGGCKHSGFADNEVWVNTETLEL
ncbi:uncharacterized protein CPUR_07291 [Claviceps purpurea 20.1]|uniref:Uncharacterized protein n=1 Tax=Claviceps purpurea (strain 20.1) TaxID=1111077 RepID=M1VXQ4_CLAP2|nr:uncharacterized protein CPUR_07291 [Claviceps purpurea 20.1]